MSTLADGKFIGASPVLYAQLCIPACFQAEQSKTMNEQASLSVVWHGHEGIAKHRASDAYARCDMQAQSTR